ncbi:MAG TPA: iron chelate uptake ABC transporter family permease subunit [Acidimicrobiales bacterium]
MTAVLPREAAPERARPSTRRGLLSSGWTRGAGLLVAAGVLVALAATSVAVGSKQIGLGTVWDALWSYDSSQNDHLIIHTLRIPRTVIGLAVGAALGLAGGVMQGVTRNPLADPGILGIQAGSSLAVVVAIYVFDVSTLSSYVWFAFLGAAVASVAVYLLGSMGRGGATPVKLALAGAAMSALLASFTSTVLLLDVDTLDQFRFWVVGSLAGRDAEVAAQVMPFLVAGTLLALASARSLNTLALGEDVARSLGQRVQLARAASALAVVLLCGGATAAAGPIAFIGLTIPHVARAICGPDHRWLLPWCLVLGPTLLLSADVLGRIVARPGELQVGIVTALLGAPFFIMLVRRRKLAEL